MQEDFCFDHEWGGIYQPMCFFCIVMGRHNDVAMPDATKKEFHLPQYRIIAQSIIICYKQLGTVTILDCNIDYHLLDYMT